MNEVNLMKTIFLYRGRTERLSNLKMLLRTKPWRILRFDDDKFDDFFYEYMRLSKNRWLSVRGETQIDEDWLMDNFAKQFIFDESEKEETD